MERLDYEEEIFLAIRQLMERHGATASAVRRLVTQAVNDNPKGELRERVLAHPEG